MNKLILAFMLFLTTFSINAQSGHDQHRGDRNMRELNLTPTQQEQMKAVREEYRGVVKTIRASELSKEEKRSSMTALLAEARKDVIQFLSEDQLIQWDAMQLERKNNKQKRHRAKESMNLTPEQNAQMKQIRENYRSAIEAIRASEESKEEKIAGRNAIKEQMRTDVEKILTPEQMVQYDQMQSNRKKKGQRSQKHD